MLFNPPQPQLDDRVGLGKTAHLLQCSHSHCSLEDCIRLLHVLCNSHLPRKVEHGCSTEGGRQGNADAWGRACNATFPDGQYYSQRQNDQGQHLKACWHLHAVSVLSAVCLSGRCQYLWQGHAAAWGRACNATFPDGQYHSQCQNDQQQHLKPCQHLHAILCVSHAPVEKRCGADALRASLQCCLP